MLRKPVRSSLLIRAVRANCPLEATTSCQYGRRDRREKEVEGFIEIRYCTSTDPTTKVARRMADGSRFESWRKETVVSSWSLAKYIRYTYLMLLSSSKMSMRDRVVRWQVPGEDFAGCAKG
ncbi:hypothetical protein HRR81_007505 [Exophiala dermatitidis]|nr:hypothetical protein HRR74_006761 [Exophiala dermatitidis]KAJ4534890.1 hypothetical protein HRR76_006797 [Exophiala dermatitidis]KAJ4566812.1 hypothetical protein HRR81_007505 [Exophiala dermatitidis]KAJ4592756.1 hypothetical protein HRR84_007117 [Exophiala dermatitidis]KAJ4617327.1 hypothetical protein HRR85_002331 [Exophiala dermatitidis]